MAFTIEKNDVSYSKESVGFVIDVSFLKNLQIKSGKDQKLFEKAINDWAENQVDQDIEQKQLKAFIESKKGNVDDYFDNELLGDYYNDRDSLKALLVEYVDTVNNHQYELRDLASAIDFRLTEAGNNKVMNGAQVNQYVANSGADVGNQGQNNDANLYDRESRVVVPTNTGSGNNPADKDQTDPTNPYGNLRNVAQNEYRVTVPNQPSDKIQENIDIVPNQSVNYKYESIYSMKNVAEDVSADSRGGRRNLLRKWMKGNTDGFIDIQELTGRDRKNIPSTAERSMIKENFFNPLKRLTVNKGGFLRQGLGDDTMEEFVLWDTMVQAFNAGKLKQSNTNEKALYDYRFNETETNTDLSIEKSRHQKLFAEEMAKLSMLYAGYRGNGSHINGTYTGRLIAMMDQSVMRDSDTSYQDIHNANNDYTGTIELSQGEIITKDNNRHQDKAVRELKSMSGSLSDKIDFSSIVKKQYPRPNVFKDLLNKTQIPPKTEKEKSEASLRYRFDGGKELFEFVRMQKENTSQGLSYTTNADVMLAEGYAFGANPVDIYNIKSIAEYASTDKSDATRFMYFLADHNNNGRVGPSDHAINHGAQVLTNYRIAVPKLEMQGLDSSQAEKQVAYNLLHYIKSVAANNTDHYVKEVLELYTGSDTKFTLLDIAKNHPGFIVYMQNIIKNLPANVDLQSIMTQGDPHTERMRAEALKSGTAKETYPKFYNAFTDKERQQFNEIVDTKYNVVQSQIKDLPVDQQGYFGYITRESLAQHMAQTVSNALEVNDGALGLGAAIPLAQGIQANISLAAGADGIPVPGVGLGINGKIGEKVFTGLNINFLVPAVSGRIGTAREGKNKQLANTLTAKGYKTHAITAHGGISVRSISAGLGYQQDIDHMMRGIDMIYNNILQATQTTLPSILKDKTLADKYNALRSALSQNNYIDKEPALMNLKKDFIEGVKQKLSTSYKNSSPQDLQLAAENIFQGMINADFQGSGDDYEGVASYFAEQWKQKAVNGLSQGLKLTGWGVGLHAFISPTALMGVLPVAFRLSKYDRGYKHRDTDRTLVQQRQAEWAGKDNRFYPVSAEKKVASMNKLLASDSFKELPEDLQITVVDGNKGKLLAIPAALYTTDRLNIKISPSMKGRIASQDGMLYIPVDAPLRFSALTKSQGVEYILNIGSTVTAAQDVHLLKGREGELLSSGLLIDNKDDIESSKQEQGQEGVNMEDLTNKLSVYGVAVESFDGTTITFKNSKTVSANAGVLSLDDGRTITFALSATNSLSFVVRTKEGIIDGEQKVITYAHGLGTTVDQITAQSGKGGVVEQYEKNTTKLQQFIDGAIDAHDPKQLAKALEGLSGLDIPEVQEIIKRNDSVKQRQLVAYMTQAFAIEDVKYRDKTASALMDQRDATNKNGSNNPAFMRIAGSEGLGSIFGTGKTSRDFFKKVNGINEKPNNSPDIIKNNLIGYTAFYRSELSKPARGYAITLPGYTRVLGGETTKFETDSQRDAARDWLLSKIRKDDFAKDTIVDSLKLKLPSDVADKVNKDNVLSILQGDMKDLGGCKIDIKSTPVYYLLGECANESIGLEIEAVTCTSVDDITTKPITVNGNMIEKWEDGVFAINTRRTTSTVEIGKRDLINFGIVAGGKIGKSASGEQYNGGYTGNEIEDGNSGGHTGVGISNGNGQNTGPSGPPKTNP